MKRKKATALRKFGLELVGCAPWGTHLCQFYETKEDLIDILVPYFVEGLRSNEFCMWITSPPLGVEEAKQALKKAVPELDQYIQKGQIEILSYTEWYLLGGAFDSDRVLRGWAQKEKAALDCGFDGLRLSGNTFWLERNGWKAFTEYEEEVNNAISKYRMIAVCTYSLNKCNANEVIDVVKNHQFALIKRSGKWELIESSETKKVQSALLRSEKKFSALYSSMIEGVAFHDFVYDSSGKAVDYIITDVNPSYEKITGLPKKQVIGKRASELYGTGEPPYLDVYEKVVSSGEPAFFETYFLPMQKHVSISVFSPSKGKFTTVFHDITQHRQAEEALRSAALFPEQNPFSVLRVARDGTLLYANKASACLLDLWDCQSAQRVPEQIRQQVTQALDTQQITQLEVACGSVTYSFVIAPIAQHDYANLYGNDITERKKAEDALRRLNERFEIAQRAAGVGVWDWDVKTGHIEWTPEMFRLFGLDPQKEVASFESWTAVLHPEDREKAAAKIDQALKAHSFLDSEYRIVRPDGKKVWINTLGQGEYDDRNQPTRMSGICIDITERKQMESKLEDYAENLERLVEERTRKLELSSLYARSLIEASLDPLVTINVEGEITDVNRATELATGCSREQLIGSVFSDYFTEPEKARMGYKKVFAEGFVRDYPLAIRHKSGKTTDVLYNASIYRNTQGKIQGVFAAARDITEIKKAQKKAQESAKKLKDAERLAAIGATAGMVGHDIRNPLQAILGELYLAKAELPAITGADVKNNLTESIANIECEIQYINKIVLDLQDFAKPLNPHAEETDIEMIINALLVGNGVPKNIQADAKVDVDAKKVMADSAYMKRILGNLFSNAVQAMPNGGKLAVRAYREAGDIVITVEDTGVGIPEEAKPQLFQPLFTTKSKGQGFGLAVIKRLTEALNGTITFESQEGKGTKFAIRFPPPHQRVGSFSSEHR